jgi:hypothetical protein
MLFFRESVLPKRFVLIKTLKHLVSLNAYGLIVIVGLLKLLVKFLYDCFLLRQLLLKHQDCALIITSVSLSAAFDFRAKASKDWLLILSKRLLSVMRKSCCQPASQR